MGINKVHKALQFKVLAILAIVATLSLGVYMYQGNNIILQVEDEITEVVSYAHTVEDLLEKEEILIEEGGYINISADAELEEGMHIIIRNPKPYTISLGGMIGEVQSIHNNVGEILDDLGIVLNPKDYVYPDLKENVSPGANIEVNRVTNILETVESNIPFDKLVNKSKDLDKGTSKTVQKGEEGLKKTEYNLEYINGDLVSNTVVSEEVIKEPVSEIVEQGTREKQVVTSRGNTDYQKVITMSATAYDLSYESTGKRPGDKYYGITASGTKARPGVVAVDPRVIPLGTKLYVESTDGTKDYGFAIAEDKGGAIKGNKIDLFFETANQVRRFGRRNVKVYILK